MANTHNDVRSRFAMTTSRRQNSSATTGTPTSRTFIAGLVAWLLVLGGVAGCSPGPEPDAPALTLPTLDGGTIELTGRADKSTLVVFFAINNPLAIDELARLEAFSETFAGSGPELIAVARSDERPELVRTVIHQHGFLFPVALDAENEASSALKVTTSPVTFLIARGRVVYSVTGPNDLDALQATIAAH